MKIQVWSDFRCPFCYIGKRHLEDAIKKMDKNIEIEVMSYELDHDYVGDPKTHFTENLAKKYGITVEQAKKNNERVIETANEAGLRYDFDNLIDSNSFKLHKLFQYAKEIGKGNEFFELGMSAHFILAKDINDDETIVKLGETVGINREKTIEIINSEEYGYKVIQDQQLAKAIGVKGVPHFVINDKVSLSGAQPIDVFIDAINYTEKLTVQDDLNCTDESCAI